MILKIKNFKKVAVIGMGGSILGTEAIYNFKKNKRKFYFFNDKRGWHFKIKKEKISYSIYYYIKIQHYETISNIIAFDILKNKTKILLFQKKTIFI